MQKSLEAGALSGNDKLMFLREAFTFYYGVCPNPLPHEYEIICEAICDKYPELKDKLPLDDKKPWVSSDTFLYNTVLVCVNTILYADIKLKRITHDIKAHMYH